MMIIKKSNETTALPCYVAGKNLTAYRRHKLEDTQWESGKRLWARTDNAAEKWGQDMQTMFGALMSPVGIYGGFSSGQLPIGILGIFGLLLSMLCVCNEIPAIRTRYANSRIKHARVDRLKLYALEGPVPELLSVRLTCSEMSRLVDWLEQDISVELHQAFVGYYDRLDLALTTIDSVEQSSIESGLKLAKLAMLHDKVADLADEAVVVVRGIFMRHDEQIERQELEAHDAMKALESAKAEATQMNVDFANAALLQQVDYVLSL